MQQYTVQAGDTPWSLAERYTGRSTRWGELVGANPHKPRARDGNFLRLEVGEALTLPPGWPSPAHGRTSPAASSRRSFARSSEAGELGTTSAPERIVWVDDHKGGKYSTDLRWYVSNPKQHNGWNHSPTHEWWTDQAWDAFLDMADAIGADPDVLMQIAYNESGLEPWIVGKDKDGKPVAWGLYQITGARNPATGMPNDEFKAILKAGYVNQTAAEQIPYMRRHWEGHAQTLRASGRTNAFAGVDPGVFYAFNAAPSRVGDGSAGNVLYSRVPGDKAFNVTHYENNRSLDLDTPKDGRITIGELGAKVRAKWNQDIPRRARERIAAARARRMPGTPPAPLPPVPDRSFPRPSRPSRPSDGAEGGGALLLLVAAGAAAWWFSGRRRR